MPKNVKLWCATCLVGLVGLVGVPAAAQTVVEGQGVADRSRPDYDPIGDRLGTFTLYPSVTLSGAATDNYLATNTNRRGDVFFVVQPELYIKRIEPRDRVEARLFVNQSVHANLPGENVTQYGASASGDYEPMRDTQLRADVSVARYVESRSSLGAFQQSAEPVQFDSYHAGLGATHSFVDLGVGLSASVDRLNFHDTVLGDGTPVDQDYRDERTVTLGGDVSYDLRNGISLLLTGSYTDERYDIGPGRLGYNPATSIDRDSSGFNLVGGVSLELSKLIFGHLQIGYISRSYADPRLFSFSGLSYSGDILWNVTPLTSIRFRASRSVQDTSSFSVAGNARSDFSIGVDHELFRYLILSGDVSYGHFYPIGVGVGGDEYSAGIGARYLIDRRFTVSGSLRHSGRSSDSSFLRYQATLASVSLRVAF